MVVAHPLMYVTNLAAEKEASSSHVRRNFVTNSYNSLDDPPPQQLYVDNPSSTRAKEEQRGRYVRGVIY